MLVRAFDRFPMPLGLGWRAPPLIEIHFDSNGCQCPLGLNVDRSIDRSVGLPSKPRPMLRSRPVSDQQRNASYLTPHPPHN